MNESARIQSAMSECLRGASQPHCQDTGSSECTSKLDFKCLCSQPMDLKYVFQDFSTCIVVGCDLAAVSGWVSLASAECSTKGINIKTVISNNPLMQLLQMTNAPSTTQGAGFTRSTLTRTPVPYTAQSTASQTDMPTSTSMADRMDSRGSPLAAIQSGVIGASVSAFGFACIMMTILWWRVGRRRKKSYPSQKPDHGLDLENDLPELAAESRTHEMDAVGEAAELPAPLQIAAKKRIEDESGVTTVDPRDSELPELVSQRNEVNEMRPWTGALK